MRRFRHECRFHGAMDVLPFSVSRIIVDESSQQLFVWVVTRCEVCGQASALLERLCGIQFESYFCHMGHQSRQGRVTNLHRENGRELPDAQTAYEVTVEVRCDDCKTTDRRIIKAVIGTLPDIKAVKIGTNGIETER